MEKPKIRVSVLDGCYPHLLSVGVPLPLCVHMQELGLMLGTAQWTAKQSSSGFSVSFFWPASHPPFCSNPRKRRRRRKKHNNRSNCSNKPKSPSCEKESAVQQSTGLTTDPATVVEPLLDAHSVPSASDGESDASSTLSDDELDLKSCESVVLECRDDVPGVSYEKDGGSEWTRVESRRKRRKRKQRKSTPSMSTTSSSDSDLDLTNHDAEYLTLDGTPGISHRNVSGGPRLWTPIAARTRYKLKTTPKKS